ncbi:MAG: hypothetical protein JXB47_14630 [Anaerolineae bacterium]|nr:hypothetical protein [Anaerolineae bacterium]
MLEETSSVHAPGAGANWAAMFEDYGVGSVVLDRFGDRDLVAFFRSQPGWAVDFEDEETVIFVKSPLVGGRNPIPC